MRPPPTLLLPSTLALLAPGLAALQQPAAQAEERWRFELVPYLWAASLDGSTVIGSLPEAEVDASFGELFENLEFAAATFFNARKGRWSLLTDASYTGIEIEEQSGASTVTIDSSLLWTSLAGGYRLETGADMDLDVFAGARYYSVDNDASSTGGVVGSRTKNEAWIDPLAGFLLASRVNADLSLGLLVDVGGFGVGSDLTLEVLPSISYRLGDTFSLRAGYRWMDVDFEDSDFEYDMLESGLMLGCGIVF
jgi:hypothetical protein